MHKLVVPSATFGDLPSDLLYPCVRQRAVAWTILRFKSAEDDLRRFNASMGQDVSRLVGDLIEAFHVSCLSIQLEILTLNEFEG